MVKSEKHISKRLKVMEGLMRVQKSYMKNTHGKLQLAEENIGLGEEYVSCKG